MCTILRIVPLEQCIHRRNLLGVISSRQYAAQAAETLIEVNPRLG
jgi:hypothetical protein